MLVFVNIEKNNFELWACFATPESFRYSDFKLVATY